jgi:hypothetical protein
VTGERIEGEQGQTESDALEYHEASGAYVEGPIVFTGDVGAEQDGRDGEGGEVAAAGSEEMKEKLYVMKGEEAVRIGCHPAAPELVQAEQRGEKQETGERRLRTIEITQRKWIGGGRVGGVACAAGANPEGTTH